MHNTHEIRELGKVLQVAYFETLDASQAIIESVKKFDDPERNGRFEQFAQKVLNYQDQLKANDSDIMLQD